MIHLANPALLAGLLALGLPLLIHLLTRPRPRRIPFPTVHLLMAAGSGRQALDRLRTILVLILRTLAVAGLILLFTKPLWSERGADPERRSPRHVILLDASLSMRAAPGGVPLFTHARARAADLLRELEPGSQAAVILVTGTPRPLLPALSPNLAALHEALATAEASYEEADAPTALALATRLLGAEHGTITVVSDFQRANWGRVRFDETPGVAFVLHPVTDKPVANLGITALECTPSEPTAGERVELAATVFNSTPTERTARLKLDLEGVGQEKELLLTPYASASATFAFSLPKSGAINGEVRLVEGDALVEDDLRHLRLNVRDALEALIITDAARGNAAHGGCAPLLAAALAPRTSGIRITTRHGAEVDRESLERADLFLLASPLTLVGETPAILARRLHAGAGMIIFLDAPAGEVGPRTLLASLDGALAASEGGGSLPVELTTASRPALAHGERLTSIATEHPVLRLFHAADEGDLETLLLRRHQPAEPRTGRAEEVLASYADGTAALTLTPLSQGGVVIANLALDPTLSNLAGSPLFPALLHELLRGLRRHAGGEERVPGRGFTMLASAPSAGEPRLIDPDGAEYPLTVLARGRRWQLSAPPLRLPGRYRLADAANTLESLILNVSPRESDTRAVHLEAILDTAAPVTVVAGEGNLLVAGRNRPLWPTLLTLTVLALAAELLLLALWPKRLVRRSA